MPMRFSRTSAPDLGATGDEPFSGPLPELLARAISSRAAGGNRSSVALLRQSLNAAPDPLHLDAARLASEWKRHELAIELYLLAARHQALDDVDRLELALATLAAAEQLRLPHGRQGAWARHKVLLIRAESLLTQFSGSTAADRLRAAAWTALARTLRLQRAAPQRIAVALAQAAELHQQLREASSGVLRQGS